MQVCADIGELNLKRGSSHNSTSHFGTFRLAERKVCADVRHVEQIPLGYTRTGASSTSVPELRNAHVELIITENLEGDI